MLAGALEQVRARGVGREGLEAELADQPQRPVLRRPDPLAADLDDLAVADRLVEGAAADPVARLEHDGDAARPRPARGPRQGRPGRRRRPRRPPRFALVHAHTSRHGSWARLTADATLLAAGADELRSDTRATTKRGPCKG